MNKTEMEINHRQPKFFYGPLLSILLAAVLAKAAGKQTRGSGTLHLSYEPHTWYHNPLYNYHQDHEVPGQQPSVWYPVDPSTLSVVTGTTHSPELSGNVIHEENFQEIAQLDPNGAIFAAIDAPPDFGEEVAASNVNSRRQKPETVRRRRTTRIPSYSNKRNGDRRKTNSNQRRRKPSTEAYYDNDYDYITRPRKKNKGRTRPSNTQFTNRRRVTPSLYDEYEYDDSFETSTRPYNKYFNRKRPYRGNNRIRDRYYDENYDSAERNSEYYEDQYDYASGKSFLLQSEGLPSKVILYLNELQYLQ